MKLKQLASRLGLALLIMAVVGALAFPAVFVDRFPGDFHREFEVIERSREERFRRNSKYFAEKEVKYKERNHWVEAPSSSSYEWPQGAALLGPLKQKMKSEPLQIGLYNVDPADIWRWNLFARKRPVIFPLEAVNKSLKWNDLYPEWIDEEQQVETPKCPLLLLPSFKERIDLDALVVRVPCDSTQQLRDVGRLQLLRGAASIAVRTGNQSMHVLILSECRPIVNLFTCGELMEQRDQGWLYKVDVGRMQKQLALPVGSCELSVPLTSQDRPRTPMVANMHRHAYATILHTRPDYTCGAIMVARSIRLTGSKQDLIVLVDENILPEHRQGLSDAGWQVRQIERVRNPHAEKDSYNEWNYSKLRLWQLTDYSKVIFIDADNLVLRNLDFLFDMPEIVVSGNTRSIFNSGVMVIEPSNCTFQLFMDQIEEIVSYNGGDQGFLNEIFPWWHRLPKQMNFLKHFWSNETEYEYKTRLFAANPPVLYVLHYLGIKPWLCYRDYDCNWNVGSQRMYASDAAHAQWFKIHDHMPKRLQQYCWLPSLAKACFEFSRRQAEASGFPDRHWAIKIKDSRLKKCSEKFCDWKSMLVHWGQPLNSTETNNGT